MDYSETVLVTGAAGFIASHLCNFLTKKYPEKQIVGLDKMTYCSNLKNLEKSFARPNFQFFRLDLCDEAGLQKLFETFPISSVYHLAAYTHVDHSFGNSLLFTKNNVLGTHTLLEVCRNSKIRKFLHMSTDEVMGSKEEMCTEYSLLDPTNVYAATKAAAEHLVTAYFHSFHLPVVLVRCNNAYGSCQYPEKAIPRFALRLLRGKKCDLQGSGLQKRSFLHTHDFCRALDVILEKGVVGEIYHVGSSDEYSILDLLTKMISILHPENPERSRWIRYAPDREFNDQRYWLSTEKIRALGWKQEIPFEEGLRKTIEWYRTHPDHWEDVDRALSLNNRILEC